LTLPFNFFGQQKMVPQTIAVYEDSSMDFSAWILQPTIIHPQSQDCWQMILVLINADTQHLVKISEFLKLANGKCIYSSGVTAATIFHNSA
jgi:hypothetical protein